MRIREAPEQSIDINYQKNIVHSPSSSKSSQGPLDEQDSDGDQYVYFKKRGQDFKVKIDSSDEECELSAEEE